MLQFHVLTHLVLLSARGVQLQGFTIQILILHQVQKFREVFRTCRNNLFFVALKEKTDGSHCSQPDWVHCIKKQLDRGACVEEHKSTYSITVKSRCSFPYGLLHFCQQY